MNKSFSVLTTALVAAAALAPAAAAGPVISAQSIIVNPVRTPLNVQVWTDRDTSGTRTPDYQPGDRIRIFTKVNENAYVYLFNVDPSGQVDMILPNNYGHGANYLRAGQTKVFPDAGDNFTFDIAAPYGMNKVLALASRDPLNLNQLSQFRTQNSFTLSGVQGQRGLAQALSIVVNPIEQTDWVTDVAYYNVAQRYTAPAPVRPAPIQNGPVYYVPQPNYSVPVWNTTFQLNDGLNSVYDQYIDLLGGQGYRVVDTRRSGNRVYTTFNTGASLMITKNGTTFTIKLAR